MKIQITDRVLWLDKVNLELQEIYDTRATENAEMEALPWYRSIFIGTFDYPSMYRFNAKYDLERFKTALESEGTGNIYVGADVLRYLL